MVATWTAGADSLMNASISSGWIPVAVQGVTLVLMAVALGIRSQRWWVRQFPIAIATGIAAALWARWLIASEGMAGEPVPGLLWFWIALTGISIALLPLAWRAAGRWRRTASLLAIPLCLLCAVLIVNIWVGYARNVQAAWTFVTMGPLPNQATLSQVRLMAAQHNIPHRGRLVPVVIGDEPSGFKHRTEMVYLPPVWFTSNPPPALPVLMMIGGEFGSSADWVIAGNAADTLDAYAADNKGVAPVAVFVDKGGAFNKDTECVNGTRGNAADHLTKDVLPFMAKTFGVSRSPAKTGVVGWSMGGTCALTLTVRHPDIFGTFVDISGDEGPNTGTREQTIDRLFGGDAEKWAAFDPVTVMTNHVPYEGVSGVFAVEDKDATPTRDGDGDPRAESAQRLCSIAEVAQIACWVRSYPGNHDWAFGADVFARTLPWLWQQLSTPGIQSLPESESASG